MARTHVIRRRGIEWLLWMVATVCLAVVAYAWLASARAQHQASVLAASAGATQAPAPEGPAGATTQRPGDVIGRLEIPAIELAVPMTAGIETTSLLRGVGHIAGTALPGGLGTLGLAGHRDTYFRPLRHIRTGMDIRVTDSTGTYHYEVDSTEIVDPEQVDVLAIRERPELTLVTCYPFDFVGAAPRRFIVHAHLLSASPDKRP